MVFFFALIMPVKKKFTQKVKDSNQWMILGLQLFLDVHNFIWQNKLNRYWSNRLSTLYSG